MEFDTGDSKKEETKGMELERTTKEGQEKKVQTVSMPEGTIEFEIDESDQKFDLGICSLKKEILRRGRKKSFRPGLPRPAEIFLPVRKIGNME